MFQQSTEPPEAGKKSPLIVLVGPTGVGKTSISLEIAQRYACEIVGVDSMQIYRYLDIGTAKPTLDERQVVPHHLIDFVEPDEDYQAARFALDAEAACADIRARGKMPLMVGGTGLYLKSFLEGIFDLGADCRQARVRLQKEFEDHGIGPLWDRLVHLDSESASRLHTNDVQRILRALEIYETTGISWSEHLQRQKQTIAPHRTHEKILKIGLNCDRKMLYSRINARVDQMLELGLIDEVQGLLNRGYSPSIKSMQSLGYRHIVNYIDGIWSLEEALRLMARDTRHYAKRQLTWFGRDQEIKWYGINDNALIFQEIDRFLGAA